MLGHYVRSLVEASDGRPLLVFVDDRHHLDAGSATLINQLALTRAATVLATVGSAYDYAGRGMRQGCQPVHSGVDPSDRLTLGTTPAARKEG